MVKPVRSIIMAILWALTALALAACSGGSTTSSGSGSTTSSGSGSTTSSTTAPAGPSVISYTLGAVTGGNPLYAFIGIGGKFDGVLNPTLRAKVGDTVRITFINTDETAHNLLIDAFGINMGPLQTQNESAVVEFVVDQAGEFEYYCNIESHNTLGMVGKLIVEGEVAEATTEAAVGN